MKAEADKTAAMKPEPSVSVILPVFNGERTVAEAVTSILGQSFTDFELLVVNDASTDQTRQILQGIPDPRVRVIGLDSNVGRSKARNMAMTQARGTLLAMMDADDLAYPDRLEKQVAFMQSHPDIALCGAWARIRQANDVQIEWRQPVETAAIRRSLLRSNPFIHCTVMLRREVAERVGGFDPEMEPAEDYDLYLRIARRESVAVLPCFLAEYRMHGGLWYRLREQWAKIPVRWKAVLKYGYPWRELAFLATPLVAVWVPVWLKLGLKRWLAVIGHK